MLCLHTATAQTFGRGRAEDSDGAGREHAQLVQTRQLQHVLNATLRVQTSDTRMRAMNAGRAYSVELHGQNGVALAARRQQRRQVHNPVNAVFQESTRCKESQKSECIKRTEIVLALHILQAETSIQPRKVSSVPCRRKDPRDTGEAGS